MREIARKHLGNRGYVVRMTTHREGDLLVGKAHVTQAATDETVAKFVTVGRFDNLEWVVGVDASEGILRDLIGNAATVLEFLRTLAPGIELKRD